MIKKLIYIASYVLFGAVIAMAIYLTHKYHGFKGIAPENIKNYLTSFGALAPFVFILLFTFVPLTLFPDSILAIAAGLIFGLPLGTLLTLIGALSGATLSFFITRLLGREVIKKYFNKDLDFIDWEFKKSGFLGVVLLRLIPLIPFDLISYGAGLSKIKYRVFAAATLLGIIPGVLVYVNIGSKSVKPNSLGFIASLIVLLSLITISYFIKKHFELKDIISKEESDSI